MLAIVPSPIASCQIHVIKPLSALDKSGIIKFKYFTENKASLTAVRWADIVVFCRNTEPAYGHLLNEAVSINKPIIYHLDDNFWDMPFETDPHLARYHRLPPRIHQLEQYLLRAGLVKVHSQEMLDRVAQLNNKVKLAKPSFDFNLLKVQNNFCHDKIQIVYATSRTLDDQYQVLLPAMQKILTEFSDHVELTVWGCHPPELAGMRGVRVRKLIPKYDNFIKTFSAEQFDIGLAPLLDTVFHRSKTHTKFCDYGACKIAGVYSAVSVYSACVENQKTGLLVSNNTEAWFAGIVQLIENSQLRKQIKQAAYNQVYEEYRQELTEREWLKEIINLLGTNPGYRARCVPERKVSEIVIRSKYPRLAGVRVPLGLLEPGVRVYLEVMDMDRNILREAFMVSSKMSQDSNELLFSFNPIVNSSDQALRLRFVRISDYMASESIAYQSPDADSVQMIYAENSQ